MLFTLPWPPSVNHYWRHVMIQGRPRVLISAEGRTYRKAVAERMEVIKSGFSDLPLQGKLNLEVRLHPPDRMRRDIDNFGGKALLDALQEAGLYENDNQIDRLLIERGEVRPLGSVVVSVEGIDRGTPAQ